MLSEWFGIEGSVSRRMYVLTGVGLALVKYALDAGAVWLVTRAYFSPAAFLNPLLSQRLHAMGAAPQWLPWAMALWSTPFLWIGVSMSVRRAEAAGISPWLGLGFVLPILNYVTMVVLSVLPDRPHEPPSEPRVEVLPRVRTAVLAVVTGAILAVTLVGVSVAMFGSYGASLFFLSPLVVGVAAGAIHNRAAIQTTRSTVMVAVLTVFLSGGMIGLFAIEGLLCLLMAAPIALAAAVLGALVARAVLSRRPPRYVAVQAALLVFALPVLMAAESHDAPELSVTTSIDIPAPPERVWPHVIAFSELEPPSEWVFETGIAYPLRATIEGSGVGAVRHCEFSTGPFVEPITVWDAPSRLAFDVASQPQPMEEWSPYRDIHPAHLDGYLRSRHGEFRLERTATGTRLTGTTWYTIDIRPVPYWSLFSDLLLHAIHTRVLEHIAHETLGEHAS